MITVCGEALIDLTDAGAGTFHAHPGGSPCNVAVGLARLGQPTSLLARIGPDPFGDLLRRHLTDSGVSTRDLVAAAEPTTLAVVSAPTSQAPRYDFYVEGTAGAAWRAGELPGVLPDDVRALHVGSLASWRPPAAEAVETLVRAARRGHRITVSLDPNVRPALLADRGQVRDRVERLVGLADVVKASEEDLAWLYPGVDALRVVRDWTTRGPWLVVLTRGPDGAAALTRSGTAVTAPARPVRVVDTVGAGDAFTAGLLDGLARADTLGGSGVPDLGEGTLRALLDEACLVAALTCGRAGADPPTRTDLIAGQ